MKEKEEIIKFPLGYYYPSLGVWVNEHNAISLDKLECQEAGLLWIEGMCFFYGKEEVVRTYYIRDWDKGKEEPVLMYYAVLRS